MVLPTISLSDSSYITCVGNYFGFDEIFANGIEGYGREADFFIGLSTNGNSSNIISKKIEITICVLLRKYGGKLNGMCDYEFIIPERSSDRIQEIHMIILYITIKGVEKIMFPKQY